MTFRAFDPARGAFDPVGREPVATQANPFAVRRLGKTAEDRMAVEKRPRVRAAQARLRAAQQR